MSDILDETAAAKGISTQVLEAELSRRELANWQGKCDACGRWYDETPCQSPRHGAPKWRWYRRWRADGGSSYMTAVSPDMRLSLIISRYGGRVTLSPLDGGSCIDSTSMTDLTMGDRERFEYAVDWAMDWAKARRSDSQA